METKKSKYDTNPLDPEFEKRAEGEWGQQSTGPATQEVKGPTSQIGSDANDSARRNVYSEAPTRRIESPPLNAPYPSVFVPPTYSPPAAHQETATPYRPAPHQRPTSRPVLGIGLPEKWAVVLPYAPFYIGIVVSLLELFLVPRKEAKVRFHASQGFALHLAIIVVQTLFRVVGTITDSSIGGTLFWVASFAFLIVSMIRVWKGEPHRIAPLAEPAQWFNEKIELRRS